MTRLPQAGVSVLDTVGGSDAATLSSVSLRQAALGRSSVLVTLLLGAILVLNTETWLPVPAPAGELAAVGLVVVAAFTKPTPEVKPAVWAIGAMGLLLLTFAVSAVANDTYNIVRLGHLLVWGFVMIFVSTGQIDPPSLARGMAIGLVFGTVHGALTLPASHYYGRLTGYLGDPNAAGYVLLTYGLVCLAFLRGQLWRIMVGITMAVGITLTYSRTTWLAAVICIVWLLLPRKIPLPIRAICGVVVYYLIIPVADSLSNSGVFRDRVGSDQLRLRISAAEQATVETSGWFGHAPAPLTVNVDGVDFYFHSSYQLCEQKQVGCRWWRPCCCWPPSAFGCFAPDRSALHDGWRLPRSRPSSAR